MITITFDEYDELEKIAISKMITKNYKLPSKNKIYDILKYGKNGILDILVAIHVSKDKEYKKELNLILCEYVYLIDKETYLNVSILNKKGKKFDCTQKEISRISSIIASMEFQLFDYYPSQEEIVKYLKGESEEEIAFLTWLASYKGELLKDKKESKNHILNMLTNKLERHI